MNTIPETSTSQSDRRRTSRLQSTLGGFIVLPTLLCGLATLAACGARLAWPLELLCHFRVQYAVSLLILCGLLLAVRRFRWAAFAFVLFTVNAWFVAPYLPIAGTPETADASSTHASLRLVSINVYSGNPTPERVVEFLRSADADVIVVLEFTHDWEERLTVLTATHPHQALHSSAGNFGIALYSRHPLDDARFPPLSENNNAVSAAVKIDDAAVRILGAHPLPPMGPYAAVRNRQLQQLAEYASRFDEPTVVAGDLNITPFSPYFDDLLATAGFRDPRRGHGLLTTWPSRNTLLRIPIDHCLVSEQLTARIAVGPDVGSDHRPVIADLTIDQQQQN